MKLLILVFLSLFLFACGNEGKSQDSSVAKSQILDKDIVVAKSILPGKKIVIGKKTIDGSLENLGVLYREGENLVYNDTVNSQVIGKNISKFWLKKQGQYVYVFFWFKYVSEKKEGQEEPVVRGKTLFVKASNDGGKTFGKRVRVNNDEGVLPGLDIIADNKGNIAVIYVDERYPGHQVFINASKDGGKTWLKKDVMLNKPGKVIDGKKQRTSAVSPGLGIIGGGKLLAIWQDKQRRDNKIITRFLSRESNDFGQTWGEEQVIFQQDGLPSTEISSYMDEHGAYLMAAFTVGDKKGLKLFSKKNNEDWKEVDGVAPDSNSAKLVSYIKTGANKQTLYITYIFVNKFNIWHTEIVRLNRISNTWYPEKYRFDISSDGTANEQKSSYQDVAVLDDGSVVVAWEDNRGILPAVFLNYSTDNGNSWLVDPIPLMKVGAEQASMPFILSEANKLKVFFTVSDLPEGTRPTVETVFIPLVSPKSKEFTQYEFLKYQRPSQEESRKQIMKRAKGLLDARIKQDWETEWKYYDPLYRNLYSKRSWLLTRGQLKFKSFKLHDVEFTRGVYARLSGEVNFDFTKKIKSLSEAPEKEKKNIKQALGMRWGWFYDQWYFIPDTGMQERHID